MKAMLKTVKKIILFVPNKVSQKINQMIHNKFLTNEDN